MISKRLLTIANLVDKNKVVYDVGSDHGLLPCFLVMNGISPKAYAIDNKEGPLKKAKENIKKLHLEDRVICKLSNGIDDIEEDVDIITICGMGFYTIKEILEGKDLSKYKKIIVQSNKNVRELREWISNSGYSIVDEKVVFDVHYYEIVVFEPKKGPNLSEEELKYGPFNLKKGEESFINYLNYQAQKNHIIYDKSHNPEALFKEKELNDIISKIARN